MSISVQQLKRILGSFSQIVAKDVSGIKTAYATKKDVEGFAKVSDLNNIYIKKGDIHTEDYVTNVIFRDAYQNRLVKKTDLPALNTIATKQEISDAVAAIQVPSIEGLAKESEVETKLADYAKTAEVAETYATKEAVNAINGLDADTIATLKNLSQHSDLTAIANKVDNVYTKAETDDKLATKADVSAIPSVEGLAKVTDVESTYAKKSELPDVSGLATKQEVTEAVAGVQVPSIEGLAKVTDVDAKLATKADVSAIPNISNLATKEEVSAVDNKLATKADASAIPSIEGLAKTTEIETKLADYAKKVELPSVEGLAKTSEIEAIYAKKSELPSVEGLATKAEVTEAVTGLAKASEVETTYAKKSELPDVSGLATKAELPSIEGLAKTTEVVAKSVYDEKVQSLESEISTLKAKLTTVASGTTEQRPTENLVVGQQYFDTTLGVPVFWNGTEWHNPFAKIATIEVEPH
nr:MAG TPA: tailspike protein [Bacteriophage sp.]